MTTVEVLEFIPKRDKCINIKALPVSHQSESVYNFHEQTLVKPEITLCILNLFFQGSITKRMQFHCMTKLCRWGTIIMCIEPITRDCLHSTYRMTILHVSSGFSLIDSLSRCGIPHRKKRDKTCVESCAVVIHTRSKIRFFRTLKQGKVKPYEIFIYLEGLCVV